MGLEGTPSAVPWQRSDGVREGRDNTQCDNREVALILFQSVQN
jgi:hypothetical protein